MSENSRYPVQLGPSKQVWKTGRHGVGKEQVEVLEDNEMLHDHFSFIFLGTNKSWPGTTTTSSLQGVGAIKLLQVQANAMTQTFHSSVLILRPALLLNLRVGNKNIIDQTSN